MVGLGSSATPVAFGLASAEHASAVSEARRCGEARDEYVEIFSTLPGTVTVQLRVDKGKYWVLTRDTYKVITPNSMQVERDPVVYKSIYNEIQTYIDSNRFFIQNEL